jgi:hypothetical protein
VARVYVALLHYPVYDKNRSIVTTSITNIDIHDIARSCRTYGIDGFYVVTPVDALRSLARRILSHWQVGYGATYNPNRTEALDLVRLERTLEGVEIDIEVETGSTPRLVATSARPNARAVGYQSLREALRDSDEPHLILLGTGWGLTEEVVERCELVLEAVSGPTHYNHLSVRAATAVILDRLFGTR